MQDRRCPSGGVLEMARLSQCRVCQGCEGLQHVGSVEQEADLLAQVDELEAAAFAARRDIESGHGAETHAVHADEIGEVEDDALVIRQQRPDLVVECVADTGYQFAVQSDNDRVRVAIDVQRQGGRGRGVGSGGHGQIIVMASLPRGDLSFLMALESRFTSSSLRRINSCSGC